MSLIDHVLKHVRSAGHATLGAEHQLLDEFAAFLSSQASIKAFLKSKGIEEGSDEHAVVAGFATAIAPPAVETPAVEAPTPTVEAPAPAVDAPAPAVETVVEAAPVASEEATK
jgi:hypothetical protein